MTKIFFKLSAFQRVLLGLALGVFTGVFLGEHAGQLEVVGNIYVRLLQMTVLPYLLVSIIGGLGRLNADTAAKIGARAGLLVLFLWLATMLTNLLLPLAYPNWDSASFFSTSLLRDGAQFDFLQLYVPSNIFSALSNTVVPAVVLFCLLLGVALIQVKNKDTLLLAMSNVGDALMKMASYVAKLAPIGIFAISASAAGTLRMEELERLQIFLWAYLVMWGLMILVALPLFVSWATPFKYRDIRSAAGEAMVTALATGTVLVVLPMIAERCRELLKQYDMESPENESVVDVMVPTAYSFPSVGTLMGLGFILFSGWYLGSPISITQYPSYVIMGSLSAFGSMAVAIPFMLDYFNLPTDQFQLYLLGSVVTARLATAMAALHGFVICLLVITAVMGRLKWRRLFNALGVHLAVSAVVLTGLGFGLGKAIQYQYTQDSAFESLKLMSDPAKVVTSKLQPLEGSIVNQPRLDIIRERGSLRVGYFANGLPFAFRNNHAEVIGYDMDLMHALANDLKVDLEIHKIDRGEPAALLASGALDIVVGGIVVTPMRALDVAFTNTHVHHTIGLIVRDSRRSDFSSLSAIKRMDPLTLAVPDVPYYLESVKELFPNAKIETITSPRSFLKENEIQADALLYSVEAGSAWSLLYPNFTIVIPEGLKMKAPSGFALPKGQSDFVAFMNTWLRLKESNGFDQLLYDYWILGKNPKAKQPRWSIAKDVLGWVE